MARHIEFFAVGFYDADGTFFYLADRDRPQESYSYDLAGPSVRYVARYTDDRFDGYREITVSADMADLIARSF